MRQEFGTNRNGVVGAHAEHAPVRPSIEELVRRARDPDAGPSDVRPPTVVLAAGGATLVRYAIRSAAHVEALEAVGLRPGNDMGATYPGSTAVFGIVPDGDDTASAVLEVVDEGDEGVRICTFRMRDGASIGPEASIPMLRHLDVPVSWRQGADTGMARDLDAWCDRDTGAWVHRPPRHAVRVSFKRICFGTDPVMRESVDLLVAIEDGHDLADTDADAAYWAKAHYRRRGFEAFAGRDDRPHVRPGFSSWMPEGDPVMVKAVTVGAYDEFAALDEARRAADAAPDDEDEDLPSP